MSKKQRYKLSFPFNGASLCENFIGQVFGGVGWGSAVINRRAFRGFYKIMTALIRKVCSQAVAGSAFRTNKFKLMPGFTAKPGLFTIVKPAFWAFHAQRPPIWERKRGEKGRNRLGKVEEA